MDAQQQSTPRDCANRTMTHNTEAALKAASGVSPTWAPTNDDQSRITRPMSQTGTWNDQKGAPSCLEPAMTRFQTGYDRSSVEPHMEQEESDGWHPCRFCHRDGEGR